MHFIIIAGASGSGKTTLVKLVNEGLQNRNLRTLVISMDQYYRSMRPGEPLDWDDISAIDLELLYSDLQKIMNGEDITIPGYDYVTHQRIPDAHNSGAPEVIILEGIFALYDPKIRELATLTIYVDADPIETCLKRRIQRDITERGRSAASVIEQYFAQVYPGYKKFVASTKKHADLCFVNENGMPTHTTKFVKLVQLCVEQGI